MKRQRLNRDGVKSQGAYMEPAADGNWVAYTEAAEVERRLALAVAELKAWKAWEKAEKQIGMDDEEDPNANNAWSMVELARAATDADPVLAKMIGGGE